MRARALTHAVALGCAAIVALALGGCASAPVTQPGPASPPPPASALGDPGPEQTGEMTCSTSEDSGGAGVYYLFITSKTDHDFSACTFGTQMSGGLDALLAMPGNVDRRCVLDASAYRALVAVYSDDRTEDLNAAQNRCQQQGAPGS